MTRPDRPAEARGSPPLGADRRSPGILPGGDLESLLAAIVSSSDDAIVSKTLDGTISSWNTGAERLFGYSADEAIGRSILLIVPPEKHDEEADILARIRRGERVDHFETTRVAKDGRRIQVSLTISPVRDREGRIVGASKVGRDVTARKAAEAEVRASQELLRLMVDDVPALISYVDRDFVYRLNNRAYQIWFDDPSPTGRRVVDVLGAAAWEKLRPSMEAALAGERVSYEDLVPYLRGGSRWIHATYIPHFGDGGRVLGFVVLVTDLSERRRNEDAQRFLVELHDATRGLDEADAVLLQIATNVGRHYGAIRCAYGEVDAEPGKVVIKRGYTDGVPTVAGVYALETFGRGLADDLRAGHTAVIRDVHDDLRTRGDAVLAVYAAMEIRSLMVAPIVKAGRLLAFLVVADREPRHWDAHDAWLLDQVAERTYFAVAGARAASSLRESRDELRRLNAELSEADRRKDEFLAVLAHELRNPLAPIANAARYLLSRGGSDPDLRNAHGIIDRQVRHLVRLVDDLLDVSRISRGKIELQKERVGLEAILTHAVEASRPLIDAEGHRLTVSLPDEPVYLEVDLTRIAQVLQNLLNNAARYTPPGGHIALSAACEDDGLVVRVRDDGIGIPPDMLTRVFGLFAQVDRSQERSVGGLGIGLTLVKRLVELHGGCVTAHSDGPGRGSEFVIRLPAAAPPQASAPEPAARDAAPCDALRILVVDDNRDSADSLAELLRVLGHAVQEAYDGPAAVHEVGDFRPHLVLLDIGLPGANGYEVAQEIAKRHPDVAPTLVAVTGWGQDEDRRRSQQAGFDHHLVKPVDLDTLQGLLRSVARSRA